MSLQRLNDDDEETKQQTCINSSEKSDYLNGRDWKTKEAIFPRNRSETSSEAKIRANRFLRVHLQVLKALYQQDTSPESTQEDCHVEEKYWKFIKFFLKERDACITLVQRAQRLRGIYEEAMEFQKNVTQSPAIDNSIIAHQVGSPQFSCIGNRKHAIKGARSNFSRSSALVLITQPSPHYNSHRPSHAWTGVASKFGGQNNQGNNDADEDGANDFGIVSGLLKRKHHLASRDLNQRTTKLRGLVKESKSRIEFLKSRSIAIKNKEKSLLMNSAMSREDFLEAKEECEDCLVRIETKISLWKLLLQDLFGTILIK
mmetsp:Transcript_163/g.410  ORF Transcript_163/g.410 Transcript_163/m.410 type:complete len:315 (-) Transcript_163:36-980(-)